jgi:septum formation protein
MSEVSAMTTPRPLVLASASPRRRELLALLDRPFEVVAVDVDETPRPGEAAEELVVRLAADKARAGAAAAPGALAVGADTVVVVDGEVLGKPADPADAARMLRRLSGRTHLVVTGTAVADGGDVGSIVTTTEVTFAALAEADVERYVATGEPLDKAGAYGIQGLGGAFVTELRGSYHNVVGLPVAQLASLLSAVERADAGGAGADRGGS